MPEVLGPWPPLIGGIGAFLWLVRLIIQYQHIIGGRYGKEIERLDAELEAARDANTRLRHRIEALESDHSELRYLRRMSAQAGIYNPWEPPGLEGVATNE